VNVLLVGLNAKFIHSSLALYSLAAACRDARQEVSVAEYTINQELLHVLGDISGRMPTVVGIACYIWNREMVLKLTSALKIVAPQTRIVLGGPEVSGDAESILLHNPSVDFVIQGEGEESLPELLERLARGLDAYNVEGVAVRRDGGVEVNGGIRVVKDLDRLPFPYTDNAMELLNNRIVYYESSRGCPFSCSYCLSSESQGVRYRSLSKVKEELRFFLQHGVRQVKFVDRTFNVLPAHYQGIWGFLAEHQGQTNFHFEIVADRLSRDEIVWLSQVPGGLFQFEIGVQSTCEETLAAVGRHNLWDWLQENVTAILREGNIHLHLDLIVGLPNENVARFAKSFNDVYGLQPDMLQIGFLKMLPGTKMRQEATRFEYKYLKHPPYEILSNTLLSYKEVRELKVLEEVFNQTYNSGRFRNTLAFLVKFFEGDAFRLYNSLARWWDERGLTGVSHSPDSVLSHIFSFSKALPPSKRTWVEELLKVDVLMDTSRSLKGEDLSWNRERWEQPKNKLWRSESMVRRFVPDYHFTNWRDVKRWYPVEVFTVNVLNWLESGVASGDEMTPVLFDVRKARPQCHILPLDVFQLGDEN
jgi:radical SAM superfamily enzyme YgiQ (UPF0313 family)